MALDGGVAATPAGRLRFLNSIVAGVLTPSWMNATVVGDEAGAEERVAPLPSSEHIALDSKYVASTVKDNLELSRETTEGNGRESSGEEGRCRQGAREGTWRRSGTRPEAAEHEWENTP